MVSEVPPRTAGGEHDREEWYCLGLYLSALARSELLSYPCRIEKEESPDFIFTWQSGQMTGLEVTRATEGWLQREMTAADREYLEREVIARATGKEAEPVIIPLPSAGWLEGEAEQQLCDSVGRAIEKKLSKLENFKTASRHDLLVYDDMPQLGANRAKVLAMLDPWLRNYRLKTPELGKVSLIISLDVLFDLGGTPRILHTYL
jgi:hypothetical protein